jgi:hypothetical protein
MVYGRNLCPLHCAHRLVPIDGDSESRRARSLRVLSPRGTRGRAAYVVVHAGARSRRTRERRRAAGRAERPGRAAFSRMSGDGEPRNEASRALVKLVYQARATIEPEQLGAARRSTAGLERARTLKRAGRRAPRCRLRPGGRAGVQRLLLRAAAEAPVRRRAARGRRRARTREALTPAERGAAQASPPACRAPPRAPSRAPCA